ncbi:MAG: histidine kinase [Gammaproteobacteria bacterium]|nr:histidine kinase [Gammaproteobacteria bacterium]
MTRTDANISFLPEFCGARIVFVVVLLAQLLAIALTLAAPAPLTAMLTRLALISLLCQWVALPGLAALCLLQRRLRTLADRHAAVVSYVAVLLVTLVIAELSWRLSQMWIYPSDVRDPGHVDFLARCVGISAISWALALRYFYVRHQWRRRIESEADARFSALQARIRPHFLFNCMNTIAGLARQSPALAEQAVEDLSDLLRASLGETRDSVTLGEEIELCRGYLRIEQHRLGGRLQVDWQLAAEAMERRLPPLTLQPLLENAIYHGIEKLPAGGTVGITTTVQRHGVSVTLTNPTAMPDAGGSTYPGPGHHMARENVAQRLAAYFGRDELLRFQAEGGVYRVELTLPNEDTDR